ncbi:hypothetical protein AVEN_216670-1 [Araneus ventricosus]|uniref:Uncharacterized protein n=1 Tax=Araneus ventricosus TaxID=182803 RepID=A0A4Y2DX78_ARAVE|nr:hypothetical protein AVEN_216670-1 [Araneus ventricosus]
MIFVQTQNFTNFQIVEKISDHSTKFTYRVDLRRPTRRSALYVNLASTANKPSKALKGHIIYLIVRPNSYQNHPSLARSRPVHLNNSRCDSSSTRAGVLIPITGHGPTPPLGGTQNHLQRASPKYYCTHQGAYHPAYLFGGFSTTNS